MKLLTSTFIFAFFFATATASFWSLFQAPIGKSEDLNVPGDNPLKYCQDPEDYILSIDKADLTPNDLKA